MTISTNLDESDIQLFAKNVIVKWWNTNIDLISEYGTIRTEDLSQIWMCRDSLFYKSIFSISILEDKCRFEFVYDSQAKQCSFDIYKSYSLVSIPFQNGSS